MSKTFIYGAYGTGNLGDDLLLKAALLEYKDQDVLVVSYGKPFLDESIDFVEHFDFLNNPEKYVNEGDDIAFCGGGLFWAATHCEDMLNIALYIKNNHGNVFINRIGAQGFHCNIEAVKKLMAVASSISVRDINSVDILKEYNVTDKAVYLPDYVLTLNDFIDMDSFKQEKSTQIKRIAINHSATPFYHDFEHRKKTLHIYSTLAKEYEGKVEFVCVPHTRHFSCIDQNDIVNGEHFWCASRGLIKSLPFPESVEELLHYYGSFDGVIGWRYHLLILAHLFDINSAYLGSPGGHKYGAFARENNIPQINFDLTTNQILGSARRWINSIIQGN
jgi:polysaccharide pyruvyl transferase WcaK-like protein